MDGAGTFLGAIVGAASAAAQQDKQHQYDMEMAELNEQYYQQHFQQNKAYEQELWDRNNDYNSPANQAKRLSAAGINPQLALAGGVSNVASASTPMSSQAGTGSNSVRQMDIGSVSQFMSALQQIKLFKAQERQTNALSEAQEIENQRNNYLNESGIWQQIQHNTALQSELTTKFTSNQIAQQIQEIDVFRERFNADMAKAQSDLRLSEGQMSLLYEKIVGEATRNGLTKKELDYSDKKYAQLDQLHKLKAQLLQQQYEINEFGFSQKRDVQKVCNDIMDKLPFLNEMDKSQKSTFRQGLFTLVQKLFK